LSFLTYSASFLALPLLIAFGLAGLVFGRRLNPTQLGRIGAIFGATLLPFVAYAAGRADYFLQRPEQVSGTLRLAATSGELLDRVGIVAALVREAIALNGRALYEAGIGGVTDYDFGHQALLDPVTIGAVGFGAIVALWRVGHRRDDRPLRPVVAIGLG